MDFFNEGDEEISEMGYDEAPNSLWKDLTTNSMRDNGPGKGTIEYLDQRATPEC